MSAIYLILGILVGASTQTLASPLKSPDSIRERCRRHIAGLYLSSFDQNERARQQLKAAKHRNDKLSKAIVAAKHAAAAAARAADRHRFDPAKSQEKFATETKLNALVTTQKDLATLRRAAEKDLKASESTLSSLTEKVSRVFRFTKTTADDDSPYASTLTYRDACPKGRFICPLSKKAQDDLAAIFTGQDIPEPCAKYAGRFTK